MTKSWSVNPRRKTKKNAPQLNTVNGRRGRIIYVSFCVKLKLWWWLFFFLIIFFSLWIAILQVNSFNVSFHLFYYTKINCLRINKSFSLEFFDTQFRLGYDKNYFYFAICQVNNTSISTKKCVQKRNKESCFSVHNRKLSGNYRAYKTELSVSWIRSSNEKDIIYIECELQNTK